MTAEPPARRHAPGDYDLTRDLVGGLPNALVERWRHTGRTAEAAAGADRRRLYPVVTEDDRLIGVVTHTALRAAAEEPGPRTVADVMVADPVIVYANDTLRSVSYLFAEHSITSAPVIEPDDGRVLGVVTLRDMLQARLHDLTEERHRERHLRVLRWWGDASRAPVRSPIP